MKADSAPLRSGRVLPAVVFLISQVLILGAAGATIGVRMQSKPAKMPIPELRSTPLSIQPVYDYEVVVTDEQLSRVLTKLRPRLAGAKTKINHVDHALRFWGMEATFADKGCPSGAEMRRLLVDNNRFVKLFGEPGAKKPLLINMPDGGVRVRVAEGDMSSSHHDHTVASLAEVGTPLAFPIETPRGPATYRDMVEEVIRGFSLNQVEYEWSVMSFAMFLPPNTTWTTKEGQQISFDTLAQRIMRQEQPQGVCFGNHRLYSLVLLLRINEQEPILSAAVRQEVIDYLRGITQKLVAHQHAEGFWNGTWPTAKPTSSTPTGVDGDSLSDRIIATGHALEWWAMVPESLAGELHPPRPVIAAAGQWVVKTIDSIQEKDIPGYFTFSSHAGRALALWRKKFPHQVKLNEVIAAAPTEEKPAEEKPKEMP